MKGLRSSGVATCICVTAMWAAVLSPLCAQQYHVRVYSEGDGLPSSTVSSVVQGPSGRIWFATRTGVVAYDASRWTTYTAADGLDPASRQHLAFDGRGRIWAVGEQGKSVAVLDGDRWVEIVAPPRSAGCELRDVVGLDLGIALGSSCGLLIHETDGWRQIDAADGEPADVQALARFDGALWVGTPDGLLLFRRSADRLVASPIPGTERDVLGLAPDRCGAARVPCMWLVGSGRVARLRRDRVESDVSLAELADLEAPLRLAADGHGGLFLGDTGDLIYHRLEQSPERLDERNGLISGGAFDLMVDREGHLWAASARGVSKVSSFRFATLREEHGLHQDEVTAVIQRRDGTLVLGHRFGLTFYRDGNLTTLAIPGANSRAANRVLELAEQSDGTLWVAGNALGLGRLAGGAGGAIGWTHPDAGEKVNSVVAAADDRLWLASSRRVLRGDGRRFEVLAEVPSGRGVRRVVLDSPDSAYALTDGAGLYHIAATGVSHWVSEDSASLNNMFSLLPRSDGGAWVGTAVGLAELRDGEFRPVRAPGPEILRPVYFIVPDDRGDVWFGTDNGVMRWDGTSLTHLTVDDGVGGRETNRAGGIVDTAGRLWIGTTHGATIYRRELDQGVVPPSVELIGMDASGTALPLDQPGKLASGLDDLEFFFRAISFYDERNIRLRTWLEGHEPDWSAVRTRRDRSERYANLPPGRYRFHVQASNRHGPWSEVASSAQIRILAPFWNRAWFWSLAALVGVGLVVAAQRYVYRGRRARRLELEVRLRVAELRRAEAELVKAQRLEALGLLAGGIAHDFNNLLMAILGYLSLIAEHGDPRGRNWASACTTAVERARELTAQLLTFSRGGAPVRGAAHIEEVVRESAAFGLRGTGVRAEIELADDLSTVDIDAGQINQVMNNLMINAAQSMPEGGVVQVVGRNAVETPELLSPGRFVCIEVADRGRGIAEKDLPHIFDPYFSTKEGGTGLGLATAYSIVRRHDGLLTVESAAGEGTRFRMYLPASDDRARPTRERPRVQRFDHLRVLVMDDDPAVREATAEMLKSLGCLTSAAAEGESAVRAYDQALDDKRPFDVVILDLTVPGGLGGAETIDRLRAIDRGVAAVVASGYSNAAALARYREHGFGAVLRKPYDRADLAEALRQVLGASVVDAG